MFFPQKKTSLNKKSPFELPGVSFFGVKIPNHFPKSQIATSGVVQSVLLGVEESPTRVVTGVVLPEGPHLDSLLPYRPRQMVGVPVTVILLVPVHFFGSGSNIHMWIFSFCYWKWEGFLLLQVVGDGFFATHFEKMMRSRPIGFFIFHKLRLTKMSPRICVQPSP